MIPKNKFSLKIFDKNYSFKKTSTISNRSTESEKTLNLISNYFDEIGLTRVANITGLDRIGIPVVTTYRPNSKTLCTSSGKGVTLNQAKISGIMESLELFFAENVSLPTFHATYYEIETKFNHIKLNNLPFRKDAIFNKELIQDFVYGWDIIQQREVAIPLALITLDANVLKYNYFEFNFLSNGLASGNNILEAVLHGMYECIERDAITILNQILPHPSQDMYYEVDLETINNPVIKHLIQQITQANLKLYLFNCTLDIKLPIYKAIIKDSKFHHLSSVVGYGANLDSDQAIIRAITEAAQGRAVFIGGARDDIQTYQYELHQYSNLVRSKNKTYPVKPLLLKRSSFLEDDINHLISLLTQVNIDSVIVCDLKIPFNDISVVKVLIPQLEGYFANNYQYGNRLHLFKEKFDSYSSKDPFLIIHKPAGFVRF